MTEKTRILFLDDIRDPEHVLGRIAVVSNEITICRTVGEAVQAVTKNNTFDSWQLDHDLGFILDSDGNQVIIGTQEPETGMEFLKWAAYHAKNKWPKGKIFVHSANPAGRANMESYINSFEKVILNEDTNAGP
jgi:hypothetical protein